MDEQAPKYLEKKGQKFRGCVLLSWWGKIGLSHTVSHDFSGEPEKVYHALVAGMLTWFTNTHEIKSNRESGYGRYDIMIIPRDLSQWGMVIEFKKTGKNESVKSAAKSALKQIKEKKYETELKERGVKKIKKLAVVFEGKNVTVKEG